VSRPYVLSIDKWAAPIALGVAAFLFVAFFGTGLPAFDPGVRLTTQILFVVPLAAWAILRLRGPLDLLDWAVLTGLVLALVVAIFSLDRTGSLEAFGLSVAFALLYWFMRDVGARPRLRPAIALGVTTAITLWLLIAASTWLGQKVQWISLGGGIPELESGPIAGWSSANTFPILALVGLPFLLEVPSGLPRRVLGVLYAAGSLVTIPLSLGRAAYLGIIVAVVAYELLRGAPLARRSLRGLRESRRFVAVGLIGVVLAGAVVALEAARGWQLVLAVMTSRWRLWEQAASIFAARPLTGGGPSTFHWLRLENAPDYADRIGVYLAHDVLMQTVADGGLVLFAALGLVLGTYAWMAVRRKAEFDPRQRITLAVLIGFCAASLLDDMSTFNAVTAMVVTLAAWVPGPRPPASPSRGHWALPIAISLLAVVSLPAIASIDVARINADEARRAALAGNWADAAEGFRAASAAHPVDAGYRLGLALALLHAGDRPGSIAAYRAAAGLARGDPRPFGALAALSPDGKERSRLLDLAARRTIRDPQYAYRLGRALMETGEIDRATEAFALAVAIDSRLFGALPPEVNRSAVAAAVKTLVGRFQDQADIIGPWVEDDVALALGHLSANAPAAWLAVAAAEGRTIESAERLASSSLAEEPHSARPYQAAGYVATIRCDAPRVTYLRALLDLIPVETESRPGRIDEAWDDAYREQGLGDYQPLEPGTVPPLRQWPVPLVPPPPACS
jgi:tetratricopeptide (TPR) repeat protein